MKFRKYYNRGTLDAPVEFTQASLTNQAYYAITDICEVIRSGIINNSVKELKFGEQDNSTFEDWQNMRLSVDMAWNRLSFEERRRYGSKTNWFKIVSDYRSYLDSKKGDLVEQGKLDNVDNPGPKEPVGLQE
nr:MAG: internal scaffolding protein [Microvirus Sku118]